MSAVVNLLGETNFAPVAQVERATVYGIVSGGSSPSGRTMYMIKFQRRPTGWTIHVADSRPPPGTTSFNYINVIEYPIVVLDPDAEDGWMYEGTPVLEPHDIVLLPRNWLFTGAIDPATQK